MTKQEAREKISAEFISRYDEFRSDAKASGTEWNVFGKKYGIYFSSQEVANSRSKDTLKNLNWFQQNIFNGHWIQDWEKAGFDRRVIYQLHQDGFLSYNYWSNWHARATGHTDFYYISQKVAKEIYNEHKSEGR